MNPVQLKLPLRVAGSPLNLSVSSQTQWGVPAVVHNSDRFLAPAVSSVPVSAGSTECVVQGVFRPRVLNGRRKADEDDLFDKWFDDNDKIVPPQKSSRPALPPSGSTPPPKAPDDRVHTHLFIPAGELANIIDVLAAPDKFPPEKTARLRTALVLHVAGQFDKIKSGSLLIAEQSRLKRELDLYRWVMAYLKNPSDFADSGRQRMINRLLGHPLNRPVSGPQNDKQDPEVRRRILAPLAEVVLANDVMRQAVMALKIPEILDGQTSQSPGAIFYGPPGTGKTILLRAVAEVYKNCGFLAFECNVASLATKFVNGLANNLDKFLNMVLDEARQQGKIAYVFLDEATIAVAKPNENSSVKDYNRDALDVFKKYVGNYTELVFGISTNGELRDFDDALVREMRLKPIYVPPPTLKEKVRLWRLYIGKSGILKDLTEDQYVILAKSMPQAAQGAAIETIPDQYLDQLRLKKHAQGRINKAGTEDDIVSDLMAAPLPTRRDIESEITFASFLEFVKNFDYSKSVKEGGSGERKSVGFS